MFPEVSGSGLRGYSFTSELGSRGSEDVEGECDPAAMFAAGRISWRSVIAHCLGWFKWLRIPFDRQNYAHVIPIGRHDSPLQAWPAIVKHG
jgi:hypothetical protein